MLYTVDAKGNLVEVHGDLPQNVLAKNFTLAEGIPTGSGEVKAGQRITMAVTPADTAQVLELETLLGGYRNAGMAADMASPLVPVDKEEFKRRDYSVENEFEPVEDRVGRDGAINQIEHKTELVSSKTEEHALAAWISFGAENDATASYNVRQAHASMIRTKLTLGREIRIWDRLTNTNNWQSGHYTTITTNYRWNTGSTRDPLLDLHNYILASWQPVTDIFMNVDVSHYFTIDSKVVNLLREVKGDGPAPEALAAVGDRAVQTIRVPGYPPIHVIQPKKYVSGVMSLILADDVVGVNLPQTLAGGDTMATHLSFRYRGRSGTGFTVNEYVPWGRGLNGGTMLEAGFSDADVMVSGHAGFLLKSVLTGT